MQRSRKLDTTTQRVAWRKLAADLTGGQEGSRCGKLREPNHWPLRPGASSRRGLPGLRHVWPGKCCPSTSAGVTCCRWWSLLTWWI